MAISDNNPQYKYVAAGKTVLADLFTPVGVYMRMRDI